MRPTRTVSDHDLLKALAVVLGVSAITSAVSRRLRQPVVLGYIVAGLVIGPHVAIPLVADPAIVHTLSELGVTLLMFSLGLELSLRKLLRVGAGVAITTVVRSSVLLWFGFAVGRIFGWSTLESVFTGAIIAISSTTIVAKAFEEQRIAGRLRDLVVGSLVVEDLIAVLLLAALTTTATGSGVSALTLAKTAGRLAVFLVVLVAVGMLVVPRAVRFVLALQRPEATIVTTMGLCFGTALLARELGYSVALGAFIAGTLVAESGEERAIAPLVEPLRDIFAAIFFVSVGMMIDPLLIRQHWVAVTVLVLVVVLAKLVIVTIGSFLAGNGTRMSIKAGMSLAQIGEFSFIIAALGVSLGATRAFLYPVAVAVSAITTLLSPWLIRVSAPVADAFDRALPPSLQTFASLYGSWVERLGQARERSAESRRIRRLARMLAIDAAAFVGLIVGCAVAVESGHRLLALVAAGAVGLLLAVGIARVAAKLGSTLAGIAFPPVVDAVDLAAAPRRALAVTIHLACVLLVGAPIVALTQPFLPGFQGAQVLLVVVFVLGVTFWRATTNLEGHVRAGAQVILELLVRQSRTADHVVRAPIELATIVEGLGEPVAIELAETSPAIGKTLAELNLRGLTGATVLAISRGTPGDSGDAATVLPSAEERLQRGDILAVAGSRSAVEVARTVLDGTL